MLRLVVDKSDFSDARVSSQITSQNELPLQTAWTGFDPYSYSGGSSSAGPSLVEIATARSFILNRGIVTDTMSALSLEPGWCALCSALDSTKCVVSQVSALQMGLHACGD